ncbi:MAG: hypothetical protein ACP5JE_05935, partial [Thermoplasmata archaeon]
MLSKEAQELLNELTKFFNDKLSHLLKTYDAGQIQSIESSFRDSDFIKLKCNERHEKYFNEKILPEIKELIDIKIRDNDDKKKNFWKYIIASGVGAAFFDLIRWLITLVR